MTTPSTLPARNGRPRPRVLPRPSVGALAAAVVLAACGAPGGGGAGGTSAPPAPVGCRPPPVPGYPGARTGDCVAYRQHGFIVEVGGYEVLMGNWKRYTDDAGQHLVCAGVNVEDLLAPGRAVSAAQFRLRPPAGPPAAAEPAPSNGLASRTLRPGQQTGGSVCWPDPGTGGGYAGSFEPSPRGSRGVWLVSFLARGS